MKPREGWSRVFEFPWGYHYSNQAPEGFSANSGAYLFEENKTQKSDIYPELGHKVGHQLGHEGVQDFPEHAKTIHFDEEALQSDFLNPDAALESVGPHKPGKPKQVENKAGLSQSRNKTNHFDLLQKISALEAGSFHLTKGFLKVADFAKAIGVSGKTVTRWCESGRLPAFPKKYGNKTTYLVLPAAIETLKKELESMNIPKQGESKSLYLVQEHASFIPAWESAMKHRLIPGKKRYAYSARTIQDYLFYATKFLEQFKALSLETLKLEIARIPEEQIPTKEKTYKALVCFAKYLIAEQQLEEGFLEQAAMIRPTTVGYSPKRLKVNLKEVRLALRGAKTLTDKLLIRALATTGLRAAEAASVRWGDINLETQELVVRRGKGGKRRTLGVPKRLTAILLKCREKLQPEPQTYLFLTTENQPFSPKNLSKRVSRIGKNVGIELTPHSLRRYFVTSNAKKGVPMPVLQIACGHSNIKITMAYCQMDESDVIRVMRALD